MQLDAHLAGADQEQAWDRFVLSHGQGTACHLYGWKHVIEDAYGRDCYPLWVERDGDVGGVFPLVLMKGRLGGDRLISMPFLDQGGILATGEEQAAALWRAALQLAGRLGARGLEARGSVPGGVTAPAATQRFRWMLSLTSSQEDLWGAVGGKVRNQVRKSTRLGLTTRVAAAADLPLFYRLFAHNMRDLGSPVHAVSFFDRVLAVFQSRATLYLTQEPGGRAVAGGIALRFGDGVSVPWASSLHDARPACPNHSLYWKILGDALEQGCRVFDFGRSTRGTGPARFKKHWRAEATPLVWTDVDSDGQLEQEGAWSNQDHTTLVKLWQLLPLGVANRLGPVIRGQLPN